MKRKLFLKKKALSNITTSSKMTYDNRRNYLLEILSAVILSLATVASAWCAYQSSLWRSVESALVVEALKTRAESIRNSSKATQLTAIDVSMFMQYIEAYSQENVVLMNFLYDRFQPELKTALDAWIKLDPLVNEDAPISPFVMEEYISPLQIKSEELLEIAQEKIDQSIRASKNSDNYALLTVIFASVLFFSGIISKFESVKIQLILLTIGALTFLGGLTVIILSPIR